MSHQVLLYQRALLFRQPESFSERFHVWTGIAVFAIAIAIAIGCGVVRFRAAAAEQRLSQTLGAR